MTSASTPLSFVPDVLNFQVDRERAICCQSHPRYIHTVISGDECADLVSSSDLSILVIVCGKDGMHKSSFHNEGRRIKTSGNSRAPPKVIFQCLFSI